MSKAFLAILIGGALSGCASSPEQGNFIASVTAVAAGGFDPALRHKVVYEGAETLNDPALQRVIDPTRRMLSAAGLTMTAGAHEPADVVVTVAYAAEPAQAHSYTDRVAIWAETGVASSKTVESTNKSGEKVSRTTYEPRREIVGYENVQSTIYSYPYVVTLNAYGVRDGRRGARPMWSVVARHTASRQGIDRYLSYLLKASQAYVGGMTNTTLVVAWNDPGARFIREGGATAAPVQTIQRR